MGIALISETFGPIENHTWLGSKTGTTSAFSGTLDSTLSLVLFADGIVPSGLVLGKVTATGRLAPYTPGASDGTQTAVGLLLVTKQLTKYNATAQNDSCAVYWNGRVITANLPKQSGAGSADSAAKTALKNIRFD